MKNLLYILIGCAIILGFIAYFSVYRPVKAEATFIPKVYICHCEKPDSESPFQCQTLHIAIPAALSHLQQHEADYRGQCQVKEPEVTPTLTPTPTEEPEATPTPTREPEVTASPTDTPPTNNDGGTPSTGDGAVCEGPKLQYAPTVVEVKRLNADSVWIKWTPVDEGVHDYLVEYSLGPNFFMWNTKVENSRELTINYLPKWLPVFVRVAGIGNCGQLGDFGQEIDP